MVEVTPILATALMMTGGLLVFMVMFMAGTPFRRAQLWRRMGKNVGLVEVNAAGRFSFYLVKNFDKDLISHGEKSWVFDAGKVYRVISEEGGIKTKDEIDLRRYLTTRGGVPMLRVSPDDMLPQELTNEPVIAGQSRKPESVSAALKKERRVFKMKLLALMTDTFQIMLIVILLFGIINMALNGLGFMKTDEVKVNVTQTLDGVHHLNARLDKYEEWGGFKPPAEINTGG